MDSEEHRLPSTIRDLLQISKTGGTARPFASPAGFSGLFERAHLSVFRFIYGLTGGPASDAEDLTAETFSRAWKARHSFSGDDSAAIGWLFTIARRLIIDQSRRRKSRLPTDTELPDELPHPGPEPEESVSDGEMHSRLLNLLQTLPDAPREMVVLRYMLGWQVKQIADSMGIPENTVSVAIRRALDQLRGKWMQIVEDDDVPEKS